jgi:hypothetical protein
MVLWWIGFLSMVLRGQMAVADGRCRCWSGLLGLVVGGSWTTHFVMASFNAFVSGRKRSDMLSEAFGRSEH